jgi:metal-responsive CopG/Arc/MetJ family transcriptional regulator
MRTTISIGDALLRRAKKAAIERNCTLSQIIEDALRMSLLQRKGRTRAGAGTKLMTYRGLGVQPGVDLDRTADLMDLMEGR